MSVLGKNITNWKLSTLYRTSYCSQSALWDKSHDKTKSTVGNQ